MFPGYFEVEGIYWRGIDWQFIAILRSLGSQPAIVLDRKRTETLNTRRRC